MQLLGSLWRKKLKKKKKKKKKGSGGKGQTFNENQSFCIGKQP